MAFSDLWALEMLLAAFAGGAFGAAIGALPAFVFTGFLVIAGEVYNVAARTLGSVPDVSPAITGSIAFGPVFGPHISFAGGAAAVAYAAKRGYVDTGFDYHEAKNIGYGLGQRPDVLAVGGLTGILGYWITTLSATLGAPWDPIAVAVVLTAVAHRLAFGYDLVGPRSAGILDMSPFAREETRTGTEGGRLLVEPWLPYQYRWSHVAGLGLIVGVLGAYVGYVTASPFMAFGISAATLVFLVGGADGIPVTHHITLPSATGALALTGLPLAEMTPATVAAALPLWQALVAGAAFGLFGALVGELLQRIFYAHADTHLDPPAASIVVSTFLIAVLTLAGVLPTSVWVPLP